MTVDEENQPGIADLRTLLVCPICRGSLRMAREMAICEGCGSSYAITRGVPVLVASERRTDHDELDHSADGVGTHNARQAAWFDRPRAEDFEIVRPRGAPALYGRFLEEKFNRAVLPMGSDLAGLTAVVVCGGSGMDAEFLSSRGASVITTDVSLGAALRARERARRFGLPLLSVVAAAEQLPLRARAVDLAYVHDGLHHLEDPYAALEEMARVASHWVAVSEPARALATRLAVRIGWARDREEAGNRVIRLDPAEVARRLQDEGFTAVRAARYAMYYRHEPGTVVEFLSRPQVIGLATAAWRIGNAIVGRAGNKLVVVARRQPKPTGPTHPVDPS